jgi:hypothetical protein
MGFEESIYNPEDLAGMTAEEVANMVAAWRQDDNQFFGAACDLLNAIEVWLRGTLHSGSGEQ